MGDDFGRGVLISVRPEMVWKIIEGEKTVELRKTYVRSFGEPPFRMYVYCIKRGVKLWARNHEDAGSTLLNGTVCAEFVCDKIYRIETGKYPTILADGVSIPANGDHNAICLTYREMKSYLNGKVGYGYHISRLKVYRTPRFIRDFHFDACMERLTAPPQGFCYVDLGIKDVEEPEFGPVTISTETFFGQGPNGKTEEIGT